MMRVCFDCAFMNRNNMINGVCLKYYCSKKDQYLPQKHAICDNFIQRSDQGCYLTTACVQYKGLPDDCYELSTLRNFRDQYVTKLPNGEELVKKYYKTASQIVEIINNSANKDEIYSKMYDFILLCIEKINANDYESALNLYITMVDKLSYRFLSK